MEGFTGAHYPVISAAVGSCVLVYALILDIHQVLTSLPAEAPRTPVSTGVGSGSYASPHMEGPAPHFCGQLALWSRSFIHHPLAQFLDRPYAIFTGYLSQGPHVSVGSSTLYLELPLWHFLSR